MNRHSRALVAALLLTVAPFAGCGGDDEPTRKPSPSTSPGSSSTPTATDSDRSGATPTNAGDRTAKALGPCLLTTNAVSDAIAGTWSITDKSADGCSFSSDRGARLGVQHVGPNPSPSRAALVVGLQEARTNCVGEVREVAAVSAFACVENTDLGDLIVGNVIGGDDLWVVIIPGAPGSGDHAPELDAMVAILGQLPPR